MRSLKERRNITADSDLELVVTKLSSLACLLYSVDHRHFAPNEELMSGLGLIFDDLAKELRKITQTCFLYNQPTEAERKENEWDSQSS